MRRFFPSTIRSQIVPNPYSDAIYIFSFRKINPSYIGPCCRVRRDSDGSQLDIDFVSGIVDTSAISTFCGASIGRVSVYNQGSRAGDNAEIAAGGITSGSPIIYNGSTFQLFNSKNSLYLNQNALFFNSSITVGNAIFDKNFMAFCPCIPRYTNQNRGIFGERSGNTRAIGAFMTNSSGRTAAIYTPDGTNRNITYTVAQNPVNGTSYLHSMVKNGGTLNVYQNQNQLTPEITDIGSVNFGALTPVIWWGLGTANGLQFQFIGESPELIIFDYYDVAKITEVHNDINSFYSIW